MLCDHIIEEIQTHIHLNLVRSCFRFINSKKKTNVVVRLFLRVYVRRGEGRCKNVIVSVSSPTSLIVCSVASTDTRYNTFICLQLYNFKKYCKSFIPISYASVQIHSVANFIFSLVASLRDVIFHGDNHSIVCL